MEDSQRRSRELEEAQPDGIVSPDAEYHTAVEPKPSSVLRPVDVNIITAPSPVTPLAIKREKADGNYLIAESMTLTSADQFPLQHHQR